jgi:hypothetical protein
MLLAACPSARQSAYQAALSLRLIAIKKIAYNPITTGARGIKRSKGCRQWRWPVELLWCRLCRGNGTRPEITPHEKTLFSASPFAKQKSLLSIK